MILSDITLRDIKGIITPFFERTVFAGMTFGLGPAGYDIRIGQDCEVKPGGFELASSLERFRLPNNVLGVVHDKSSWARKGLSVQNTVLEPGWEGYLTLELTNHLVRWHDEQLWDVIRLKQGWPIAQVVFHFLDQPTSIPYRGKYQNQPEGPQPAIEESDPSLDYTGTLCRECDKPQFNTPHGVTCEKGHGGAEGYTL